MVGMSNTAKTPAPQGISVPYYVPREDGKVFACGACHEPVIHGPEQCIVMRMYATQDEKD